MKIAFDFDGTLVDTMPVLGSLAVALIAERYEIDDAVADKLYWSTVGASFLEQLEELFPGDPRNGSVAASFITAHELVYTDCKPFNDAVDAVRQLQREHRVTIVSSSPHRLVAWVVERIFEKHGVRFDAVLGRDYGTKAQQLELIARTPPIGPLRFIGDAPRDMTIASQLGLGFTAVTHTFPASYFPGTRCLVSLTAVADLFTQENRHVSDESVGEPR